MDYFGKIPFNIGNLPIIINMMNYIYIIMERKKETQMIEKRGIERNRRYIKYIENKYKIKKGGEK
ncbi:MAG: hypothetical protein AYK22_02380 [Thermoplasmatales archaeon SG8-52-3]|nr:MAG: hypothetical protein AYK22_02380 [Thermoplasmatales archaeon SG8-52-3]